MQKNDYETSDNNNSLTFLSTPDMFMTEQLNESPQVEFFGR
jgi:hypothetical protein